LSEEINPDRRHFMSILTMTIATARVGMIGSATEQTAETDPVRVATLNPGRTRHSVH
jgi:hypothetical protein